MACDDRQLTEAQRQAGYQNGRTGVVQAVRPFSGRPTIENLIDYINRELQPAVRRTRDKVNEIYLPTVDNAPSGNPLGFYFSTETGAADPTAGRIRLNAATQDTATILRVSESNGRLADVAPWLDVMAGGATTPLGVVTLTDAINPTRFIRFDLGTMTDAGAYWNLGVTPIESSHDNPFVDGGAVVISFIPGVGGATPATVPPTSMAAMAANTVLANATASSAAPTAFPLTASTVLGRRATGNIVALTGVQQGEIVRRETVVTDTTSSGTVATYTIAATTTQVQFKLSGTATIHGMTASSATFGKTLEFSFDSGFAGEVIFKNESATASATLDRIRTPGGVDFSLKAGETLIATYFDSRWRIVGVGKPVSRLFPGAPIYDVMDSPFNAVANGIADDLAAINAAIAAANAVPGMIYLGDNHLISAGLNAITASCVVIQGRGMDTGGTSLTCTTAAAAIVTFASGARFSGIRNVRIVGSASASGYGVVFRQAFRCFAENLRISAVGNGIEVDRCNTTYFEDIDVIDPLDDYGFYVHGVNPDFCHVTRFIRCQVGGSGTTYTGFAHGSFAHTIIYQHCGVLQGNKGMHVFDDAGSAPTFIHAWQFSTDHPLTTGIDLESCDGAVMFDQTLATSVLTPGNPGIRIGADATRWQFNGGEANQGVTVAGTAGVLRGMHASAISLAGTVDEVLVENNHLTGALTIAAGADNYVVSGNYVAGGITNTPGRADTRVVEGNVPDTEIAVGSFWALQIDHGASDVPREITKFEAGENIRRETVVVDTTSSGTSATYTIASTTTQVQFKLAGALTINGMTAATLTFGKLVVFSFDSGFAGSVTWNNESGSAGAALERVRTPGAVALTISAGETATFEYFDSRWRCIAVGKSTGLSDGDKGDVTVSSSGTVWTVDTNIVKTWTGVHTHNGSSHTINVSGATNITAGTDVSVAATDDILVNATSGLALVAGSGATGFPITTVTPGDIQVLAADGIAITAEGTAGVAIAAAGASSFAASVGNLTLSTAAAGSRVIVSGADDVLIEAVTDDVFINSGADTQVTATGSVNLTSGNAFTMACSTIWRVTTNSVERLEIEADGAWQVAGDTGDLGGALLSQGSAAPPIWGDRDDVVTRTTIIAGGSSAEADIVSLVVAAGTWVVGTTYEFYAHCEYVRSGAAATSHTVTIDAELNGTGIGVNLGVLSGVQNSTTASVLVRGTFTCSATGGGGTGRAAIAIDENILVGSTAALSRWAGTNNPSLDTTASNTLSITVDFSAGVAGASFVCQRAWIRRVV